MTALQSLPIAAELSRLDGASPLYATQFVDLLLAAAGAAGASDVHLHPTPGGLLVQWRIDGVLARLGEFPRGQAADAVVRLKVLAELLTYRTDVPQEGRIRRDATANDSVEMRVSTFPTLHGERAVVRLFAAESRYVYLADLELPSEIETALARLMGETSGAVLLTGPAGSGKTTTAYACLREMVRQSQGQRSIVTLEDPIEVALEGVSQSQAAPAAGFTLAAGLRSLMRQDPEVILVGEIRDAETVATVFQAALTGHLVFSTLHAGSAAGALSRLIDMGIEPYILTSALRAVLHQRLVRKLCQCSTPLPLGEGAKRGAAGEGLSIIPTSKSTTLTPALSQGERESPLDKFLGLPVRQSRQPHGCDRCRHTGYRGRMALAEMLPPLAGELTAAVKDRRDAAELSALAVAAGMVPLFARACRAVEVGQTDPAEVRRVLGFGDGPELAK